MARKDDVTMEGVQIRIRNFSGKEGQFNNKGERNFLVLLNDDVATQMKADGWNVKYLKPRDDDDQPQPFLKIKVNFNSEPRPRLVLVTSRNKTTLDEEDMPMLDWAVLTNVDLIVNPYHYDFNGKQGITAYLRSGYFTIEEDELEMKYAEVPENKISSTQSSVVFRENPLEEPF